MKTFKLISLQIVEEDGMKDILLDDGLIINREDENNTWLLEAYTSKTYYDFLKSAQDRNEDPIVHAIITKKENDPAAFKTKIRSVKKMDKHISVLFEGRLIRSKNYYAASLLNDLMSKGLSGESLLQEFKEKLTSRPKLKLKE